MTPAEQLKAAREAVHLSRAELSRQSGIPLRTLESWELGQRKPKEYVIKNLIFEIERKFFKMKRTIISNCWTLESRDYNGEKIIKMAQDLDSLIKLENGVYLKVFGDGRYCNDEDENDNYAAVLEQEYDENGEPVSAELLGFVQV